MTENVHLQSIFAKFEEQLPPPLYQLCQKLAKLTDEAIQNKKRMTAKELEYKSQILDLENQLAHQRQRANRTKSKLQQKQDSYFQILQEHEIQIPSSLGDSDSLLSSEEENPVHQISTLPLSQHQQQSNKSRRTSTNTSTASTNIAPDSTPKSQSKARKHTQAAALPVESSNIHEEFPLDPSITSSTSTMKRKVQITTRKPALTSRSQKQLTSRPQQSTSLGDDVDNSPSFHYKLFSTFTSRPVIPLRWHKLYIDRFSTFISQLYTISRENTNTMSNTPYQTTLDTAQMDYQMTINNHQGFIDSFQIPSTLLRSFHWLILMTHQFYNSYTFLSTLPVIIAPVLHIIQATLPTTSTTSTTSATAPSQPILFQQQSAWIEIKQFNSLILLLSVLIAHYCNNIQDITSHMSKKDLKTDLHFTFAEQYAEEKLIERNILIAERKKQRELEKVRQLRKQKRVQNSNEAKNDKSAAPTMNDDDKIDKNNEDDDNDNDIVLDDIPERSPDYNLLFQWKEDAGGVSMVEVMTILKTNLLLSPPHEYYPIDPPKSILEFQSQFAPTTISGFESQPSKAQADENGKSNQETMDTKKKTKKIQGTVVTPAEQCKPQDEYTIWDSYRINYHAIVQFKYGLLSLLLSYPSLAQKYTNNDDDMLENTATTTITSSHDHQFFWWNTLMNLLSAPVQAITFSDNHEALQQTDDQDPEPSILQIDSDYITMTILIFWFFSPYPNSSQTDSHTQSPLFNYFHHAQPTLLMHKHHHYQFSLFPETPHQTSGLSTSPNSNLNPISFLPQISFNEVSNQIAFLQEATLVQLAVFFNSIIQSTQIIRDASRPPNQRLLYSTSSSIQNRYNFSVYTHNGCRFDPYSYSSLGKAVLSTAIPTTCRCCVVALTKFMLPEQQTQFSMNTNNNEDLSDPTPTIHPLFFQTTDLELLSRQTLPYKQRLLSILLSLSGINYWNSTISSTQPASSHIKGKQLLRIFTTTEHFSSYLLSSTPWHQNYILLKHTLFPFWSTLLASIIPPNPKQPKNLTTHTIYNTITPQHFAIASFQFSILLYGMLPSLYMQTHHNPQTSRSQEQTQSKEQLEPSSTTSLIMTLLTSVQSVLDIFILTCIDPDGLTIDPTHFFSPSDSTFNHPQYSAVYHLLIRTRLYLQYLGDQNFTPFSDQQCTSSSIHPAPLLPLDPKDLPVLALSQHFINTSHLFNDIVHTSQSSLHKHIDESSSIDPWNDYKLQYEAQVNCYRYSPQQIVELKNQITAQVDHQTREKSNRRAALQIQRRANPKPALQPKTTLGTPIPVPTTQKK